jgi:putative transposase
VRYSQRLAETGAVAAVGSTGDRSYENALAAAFSSLFNAEFVRNKAPWKNVDDLKIAVAEYVDWFNDRRLHREIGLIPPTEHEENYYRQNDAPTPVDASRAGPPLTPGPDIVPCCARAWAASSRY